MPAEAAPSFLLVPELPEPGGRLTLPAAEAHYLTRVCRARPGDRASATDGRGSLATVRLLPDGGEVSVEVESCDRRRPVRMAWVLAGPPEGERGDWLVEKLGELGVTVFLPVDCERGAWGAKQARAERWRRLAVAALRQSRRRYLLDVRDAVPLAGALAELPEPAGRWLADPAGDPAGAVPAPGAGLAVALVGPAGGFSLREAGLASARGFRSIALSDSRLRTETAAVAWSCWWSAGAHREGSGGLDAQPSRP